MSTNITQMSDLMAVNRDSAEVLGKFVYFSLSNVLIERSDLQSICDAVGLSYSGGARTSDVNAFRSATGDIYKKMIPEQQFEFCRDRCTRHDVVVVTYGVVVSIAF